MKGPPPLIDGQPVTEEWLAWHRNDALANADTDHIDYVGLPSRAGRVLENAGLTKVSQIVAMTNAQMLTLPGMGPGTLKELREAVLVWISEYRPT